ncbi:Brix-domain-containing protein [Amanita rubescens]|nr:Brix-domain-containing protein [Amanita rubescens]
MLRTVKPKNAQSKRAMEARAPKEVEDPRVAIFVKGTHVGELLNNTMKELMALKRPHAISFSKKNAIHPFDQDSSSLSSLEFWGGKNDASLFLFGHSTKKRPHGLTFIRLYDGRVLDMIEVGVDKFMSIADFPGPKATPGHKPLMHFASDLFDSHPRFMQLKSMLLDFFNGEVVDSICLPGIEHVISVSLGPTPASLNTASDAHNQLDSKPEELPKVHIRTYMISTLRSGIKTPQVELTPMGPSLDLSLRRHQEADTEMLKQAMKRPKLKKQDVEKGLGKKKKNMEVDEMGDLRGRIHLGKQDLSKLQTRKMKGLKVSVDGLEEEEEEEDEEDDEEGPPRKKNKTR